MITTIIQNPRKIPAYILFNIFVFTYSKFIYLQKNKFYLQKFFFNEWHNWIKFSLRKWKALQNYHLLERDVKTYYFKADADAFLCLWDIKYRLKRKSIFNYLFIDFNYLSRLWYVFISRSLLDIPSTLVFIHF